MTIHMPHPGDIDTAGQNVPITDFDNQAHAGPEQPTSVPALLRELSMDHASVENQKVALRAWLIDNTPHSALRLSLRGNGFGLLLKEISDAANPPARRRLVSLRLPSNPARPSDGGLPSTSSPATS
jgi:hypothetical protein